MNWANRLTLSRLVMTIVFVVVLNSRWSYGRTASLIIFIVAGITDYFDGEIARRYETVTNFGKLMDPLVDKVMTAAAFICLVPFGAIPAWVATTVVARDFLITGLRLLASTRGLVLPAERLGKHKTSWQIGTILFFLLLLSARELNYADAGSPWWGHAWDQGGVTLISIMVALTIYSGLGYAWRHRAVIASEE